MEFFQYLLSEIVVSFGLLCGFFLSRTAFEELKELKKYLKFTFLSLILLLVIYLSSNLVIVKSIIGLTVLLLITTIYVISVIIDKTIVRTLALIILALLIATLFTLSVMMISYYIIAILFVLMMLFSTIYCQSFYEKNHFKLLENFSSKKNIILFVKIILFTSIMIVMLFASFFIV